MSKQRKPASKKPTPASRPGLFSRRSTWIVAGVAALVVVLVAGFSVWRLSNGSARVAEGGRAPEAKKIMAFQKKMPFQIIIPGFLPEGFNRAGVKTETGPGPAGEPLIELTYEAKDSGGGDPVTVYLREWMPPNAKGETLAGSVPIQTKWGKGFLLTQQNLTAIWADVGPTRVSVFTPNVDKLSKEDLLAVAESLGPVSNLPVFTTVVKSQVKGIVPPPPVKVPVKNGVQNVTLVITPGGYDPIRFAVKKDVPVKMTFRQLGEVGCGNELIFPSDPKNLSAIKLKSASDTQVLEFTPKTPGEFEFYCGHRMYRGLLTVTK